MQLYNNRGFTLVEIMIVVAIVALLVGVAVPNFLRTRINANETSAQATLRSFASACESYAAANSALYPQNTSDLTGTTPPYFGFDPTTRQREGYDFYVTFGNNSYTVEAQAMPNAGNWDYRVTTGLNLRRRQAGTGGAWELF